MWIIFGIIAITATIINIYMFSKGKNYKLPMAGALAFTALTLAAEYRMVSAWVKGEDWAALADVVPTMETALWILATLSIIINISPIFFEGKNKGKINTHHIQS